MNAVSVSCVIPTLNPGRRLRRALDSIATQTRPPDEIIVVDDTPDDSVAQVAASYALPIRVVRGKGCGPAAARNVGIRDAKGEFISFLDHDDVWLPEKISRQLAAFKSQSNLDVSITLARVDWEDGMEVAKAAFIKTGRRQVVPAYATPGMLAPASVFERVGLLCEDYKFADAIDWFARVQESRLNVGLVEEVLLLHYMHESNHNQRDTTASFGEYPLLFKRMLDRRRRTQL
jgi:glycosyltransferase involved in cell wall biosynthesis